MRQKYTKEFKQEAVQLTQEPGKSIKEVAEELGINYHMLSGWRRELHTNPERAFPGSGNPRDKELADLRRENRILRMERDILKKAIAIFTPKKEGHLQ